MQGDALGADAEAAREFNEALTQGGDLGVSEIGAAGVMPDLLVEHVRGGVQDQARLVGEEVAAGEPVEGDAVQEFLDAVLDVAARGLDAAVDDLGVSVEVGDEVAGVVARVTTAVAHDFGFVDHAARVRPAFGIGRKCVCQPLSTTSKAFS